MIVGGVASLGLAALYPVLPSETSIYFTSVKNFIISWLCLMFSVCYVMLMLFHFLLVSFKIIYSFS